MVFLMIASAFSGCTSSNSSPKDLTVENLHFELQTEKSRVISGFLRNNGTAEVRNAVLEVDLLDDRNQILDKLQIDVAPVRPGERTSFRKTLDTDMVIYGVRANQIFLF